MIVKTRAVVFRFPNWNQELWREVDRVLIHCTRDLRQIQTLGEINGRNLERHGMRLMCARSGQNNDVEGRPVRDKQNIAHKVIH